MKLELTNPNYNCTVVRVNKLIELEGCDNVVAFPMFWLQAITSKDTEVWGLYLMFSVEVEMSYDFCRNNNLHRHKELNIDETKTWYMEDSRRVKAIKFRWHESSALLMPLCSLDYLWVDTSKLVEWDTFNNIDWNVICSKYVVTSGVAKNKIKWSQKSFERINNRTFPEHLDSENYWRNKHKYKDDQRVIVTQKLHGTSGRWGNVLAKRKLWWFEQLLARVLPINDTAYDSIFWSRRVIKNWTASSHQQSFYSSDVWGVINERIKDVIPQDWIIYWEIVGWDWQKPIQSWYTYGVPQWEIELYVYRISVVNQQWMSVDLSWDAIVEFCSLSWLNHVPLVWSWYHWDLDVDVYMDKNYSLSWYSNCVPLSNSQGVDEWVMVRSEWLLPFLTKAKCSKFLEHETKSLDKWEVDMESDESI